VGSSAQIKAMKKVAGTLKLDLAQFRELEAFAQFGSDLDEITKKMLDRGRRATEMLKQKQYAPVVVEHQVAVLYALVKGYMDDIALDRVKEFEEKLLEYTQIHAAAFFDDIRTGGMWTESSEEQLKKALADMKALW
jgi:F-type H+-transporting ATPase subunit alpha